jgi:hypothetical protein
MSGTRQMTPQKNVGRFASSELFFPSETLGVKEEIRVSAYAATGLPSLGELPWGSHVCQFFLDGSDLRDTLVPFKAGLENNERCLLVAMEPFSADDARSALRAAVGDFDRRERSVLDTPR